MVPRDRSRVHGRHPSSGLVPNYPTWRPLAPATDLANPQEPKPNNSPKSRLYAGTTITIFLAPRVGDAKVVEATPCLPCLLLPSSLLTSKPQEHGHAGLPKPRTPDTIENSDTQLRDGGIHTKFHSRGRVQWQAVVPNLPPGPFRRASAPLPFSARSHNITIP